LPDVRFHGAEGKFGFLSNFSENGFLLEGIHWPTVEHYYQASKFEDEEFKKRIICCDTPALAKRLGGQMASIRSDWLEIRLDVMQTGVLLKFLQNGEIAKKLCKIKGNIIEVSKDDSFWGIGPNGSGENKLGQVLMEVRQRLCKQ